MLKKKEEEEDFPLTTTTIERLLCFSGDNNGNDHTTASISANVVVEQNEKKQSLCQLMEPANIQEVKNLLATTPAPKITDSVFIAPPPPPAGNSGGLKPKGPGRGGGGVTTMVEMAAKPQRNPLLKLQKSNRAYANIQKMMRETKSARMQIDGLLNTILNFGVAAFPNPASQATLQFIQRLIQSTLLNAGSNQNDEHVLNMLTTPKKFNQYFLELLVLTEDPIVKQINTFLLESCYTMKTAVQQMVLRTILNQKKGRGVRREEGKGQNESEKEEKEEEEEEEESKEKETEEECIYNIARRLVSVKLLTFFESLLLTPVSSSSSSSTSSSAPPTHHNDNTQKTNIHLGLLMSLAGFLESGGGGSSSDAQGSRWCTTTARASEQHFILKSYAIWQQHNEESKQWVNESLQDIFGVQKKKKNKKKKHPKPQEKEKLVKTDDKKGSGGVPPPPLVPVEQSVRLLTCSFPKKYAHPGTVHVSKKPMLVEMMSDTYNVKCGADDGGGSGNKSTKFLEERVRLLLFPPPPPPPPPLDDAADIVSPPPPPPPPHPSPYLSALCVIGFSPPSSSSSASLIANKARPVLLPSHVTFEFLGRNPDTQELECFAFQQQQQQQEGQ